MTKTSVLSKCIVGIFVGCFLFLSLVISVKPQSCMIPDVFSRPHFKQQIIYYYFDSSVPNDSRRTQIVSAFNNWNAKLNVLPCPAVQFSQTTLQMELKYNMLQSQMVERDGLMKAQQVWEKSQVEH